MVTGKCRVITFQMEDDEFEEINKKSDVFVSTQHLASQ